MPINHNVIVLTKQTVVVLLLKIAVTATAMAQQPGVESSQPLRSKPQSLATESVPIPPSGVDSPPSKTIHRIGTAISAPKNNISIKSTDAGIIYRQPSSSGCSNCGIVDFVNKIGQGPGFNAIVGGIVASTIAREVLHQSQHHPGTNRPEISDPNYNNPSGNTARSDGVYQVGITMNDGRQTIINLPDATNFHQGDRVKWIDGGLVLDR